MTPFEGPSTCIETARPLQLLEVLSSVCALVFLSSRSLTSLQTSGGPLTSSRITPDSLLPFVHPPPLSSIYAHMHNAQYTVRKLLWTMETVCIINVRKWKSAGESSLAMGHVPLPCLFDGGYVL